MLVKNVDGEKVSASMLKDSAFYIEIAKFVQAYTAVIQNPNLFLKEIGESPINEKKDRVTWQQFKKIMQTCDLGFEGGLTDEELIVYYNYAIEIGSLDRIEKRLASVDEVANAQKHFYNFIDEAKDRAQDEYLRQHQITENREREVSYVDNQLLGFKAVSIVSIIFMCVFSGLAAFSIVSYFYNNAFAEAIGFLANGSGKQYLGATIILIVSLVLFVVFDKLYVWSSHKYIKLKTASDVLFEKEDEAYEIEEVLKHKLSDVDKDLKNAQAELNDKEQKFDVTLNINLLKKSNKYYKELYAEEIERNEQREAQNTNKQMDEEDEQYVPVNLTKEQEENMRRVSKEAISLVGKFDEKAYNEQFETSRQKRKSKEALSEENKQKQETKAQKAEEQKKEQNKQSVQDSVKMVNKNKAEEQKNL